MFTLNYNQSSLRVRNQRKHSMDEHDSSSVPQYRYSHPNTNIYSEETFIDNKYSDIVLHSPTISGEQLSSLDQKPKNKEEEFDCERVCSETAKNPVECKDNVIENANSEKETIIESKSEMLKSPKDTPKRTPPKVIICDNTISEKKQETKKPLIKRPSSMKTIEMSSILKSSSEGTGEKADITLARLNNAPPKDQQKLVADMRRTLGPNFATMGLIMAARSQLGVLEAGVLDPEANLGAQEDPDNNSFFFQEIYTPFMEVLIKGNSGMSKINDHARTVPPCERCFFCLLILVTFIYGVGILTAVILLSSMMWYT